MANTGIWIDAPERVPLPHRLTAVIPPVSLGDKAAFGVNFETLGPEATVYPHTVCQSPSELTTEKTFEGLSYTQDDFTLTLYAGIECNTPQLGEHARRVQTKLERGESHALETYLRSSVFVTGTAFAATATTLAGKFAQAEWEALKVYQAELVAHVSPLAATLLRAADAIELADDGRLRTIAGNPVVVGTGYIDTAAPAGGAAATAGQEWAFFTGAVVIGRGELGVHDTNFDIVDAQNVTLTGAIDLARGFEFTQGATVVTIPAPGAAPASIALLADSLNANATFSASFLASVNGSNQLVVTSTTTAPESITVDQDSVATPGVYDVSIAGTAGSTQYDNNNRRALAERVYSVAIDGPILGVLLTLEA